MGDAGQLNPGEPLDRSELNRAVFELEANHALAAEDYALAVCRAFDHYELAANLGHQCVVLKNCGARQP